MIDILKKHDISTSLGLFHTAGRSKSNPLAYDLVEIFRADLVESQVLKFVRQKKHPIVNLTQKHIGIFLYRINQKMEQEYFQRKFHQCHSYKYYMELQVLAFIKAVNHKNLFIPLHLPERHETRCRKS